ncbi:MAG: pentapeptide repeat-containing protein [Prochloraceae cyanobacterium]|nr:pentapeptide repeat-containing protein [Prochloraceae cyanobacterium]
MANAEHVNILLRKGIRDWNKWRKKYRNIIPDLSEADLSNSEIWKADLTGVNLTKARLRYTDLNNSDLSNAELWQADLTGAYLWKASLQDAYLSSANLTKANLRETSLVRAQALGTNFEGATLTGACIEDWNINGETNLKDLICDFVYLKDKEQERCPTEGNFSPGEFAKLFERTSKTVDLVFRNGIDWRAFLSSFQKLQVELNSNELLIQALENKNDGALLIKLNIPTNANQEAVEQYIKKEYQLELQMVNQEYREKLNAKDEQLAIYRQQSMDLMEIATIVANALAL